MTLKPVAFVDPAVIAQRKDDAEYLRQLADRVERGDIADIVIVFDDRVDQCFATYVNFTDRWRILGALEYAKNGVHRPE